MLRVESQRHITTQHAEYSIASGLFCCVWQLTGHTVVRPKLNVFVYIIHGGEQHIRSFWTASCLRWTRANNTTLTCMFTSHESGWDGNRHVAGISRVWVSLHVHTVLQHFHIGTIPLYCEDEKLEMCLFFCTSDWEKEKGLQRLRCLLDMHCLHLLEEPLGIKRRFYSVSS